MAQPSPRDPVIDQRPVDRSPVAAVAATPRLDPDTFTRGPRRTVPGWTVLAVCCMAQFMVVLDSTTTGFLLNQARARHG